jgi:hypothetical protein
MWHIFYISWNWSLSTLLKGAWTSRDINVNTQKLKSFGTLTAPLNRNQWLQNFACSLLVTRFHFSALLEIHFFILIFFCSTLIFVSHHQTAGQSHCVQITSGTSFRNVSKVQFWGMMITSQNCLREEISRLNFVNAYYYAVQNLPSFCCF